VAIRVRRDAVMFVWPNPAPLQHGECRGNGQAGD